jgi:PhoH-like ATPase
MPDTPLVERKNYVIDTSVFAHDGESIHNFPNCNVYIPIEVLEELDNLKTRMDQVGSACRYVNRYLDGLRSKGSLANGIEIENNQKIIVTTIADLKILPSALPDKTDNKIIALAYKFIQKKMTNVAVISQDISLRVKCDSFQIPAFAYEKGNKSSREQFNGLRTIFVDKEVVDNFYLLGEIDLYDHSFFPNEGIILKAEQSSALAISSGRHSVRKLRYAGEKGFSVQKIAPRSKEQIMACELLLDPKISMVSMNGLAGTGKTLLAIASAIEGLQQKQYKKLIISRPVQSTSKDIGFLPGTKEEKLGPWLQPFFDNLEVLLGERGGSYLDMMFEKGIIEMEALTYIRGRTLPKTIFIIDEAQNITHHEAKALLTRMGEGSKIILIGDLDQIDSPSLNQNTSGLSSVIELFKEFPGSGHITLQKGERSELASFAAKMM